MLRINPTNFSLFFFLLLPGGRPSLLRVSHAILPPNNGLHIFELMVMGSAPPCFPPGAKIRRERERKREIGLPVVLLLGFMETVETREAPAFVVVVLYFARAAIAFV